MPRDLLRAPDSDQSGCSDSWDGLLGEGQIGIEPGDGHYSPDRIPPVDRERSIRYGDQGRSRRRKKCYLKKI